MPLPRSDSVSTFSTTGSTVFYDANGQNSEFATPQSSSVNIQIPIPAGADNVIQDEEKSHVDENKEATPEVKEDGEKEEDGKDINKTEPKPAEKPTYNRQRGYQGDESECHEFLCDNNWLAVLDIPSVSSLLCLCFTNCCTSCMTAGVSQAKTIR